MPLAPISLRVCKLFPERDADLPLPRAHTPGSAGLDVVAAVVERVVLQPLERAAIPTGIAVAVPPGVEIQVRPRSGLALKYGVTLLNSPGTIDSDYRGEVHVLLVNLGSAAFTVERGMRVAQLVVSRLVDVQVEPVSSLDDTERGAGGFGHTGES